MTYDQIEIERPIVTAAEARREIERHGAVWTEFIDERGERGEYDALSVLHWLGY